MARRCKPSLEALEDRTVPATFGIPWPNAGHLTLSFAPDGTQVGDQQSQLFQTLNAVAPTQAWQKEIIRAFQTWAAPTNINLSVVGDSGAPFGSAGPIQGDSRFGDIRISAVPLPSDVVAVSMPFDFTAGSWAGDVELNSNYAFSVGGTGNYDLFSVALHEAGHSFGIDESSDPASPMFPSVIGTRSSLAASDVTAIQALYGARAPDAFDAANSNGTLSTATAINLSSGGNGLYPVNVNASIASAADVDFFCIKPGNNQTSMTVSVQTSGVSLLLPRLTVYSASGAVIASAVASDPLHGDLSVHLSGLQASASYYVKVSAATTDAFSAGSYRLQIVPDGSAPAPASAPTGVVVLPSDAHTNDTIGTATDLRGSAFQTDARYAYAVQAAITDSTDVDYYHLRSPQGATGTTTVMRVLVWGTDVGGLSPVAGVYDSHGNAVAAKVLVNENGSYVVEVDNALPNTDYYVAVRAQRPQGPNNVGTYFLGVDFSSKSVSLQSFTSGTLSQANLNDFRTLQVNQSQLFHLVLNVNSGPVPVGTAVRMTIYDQAGNVVSTLTALNGETQSLTVFLAPGTYVFRFAGATSDGSPLPATAYTLSGLVLSDPIDPIPTDPTLSPLLVPPPPPPASSGTITYTPTQADLSYYWLQYGYYSFLSMTSPYGYPYYVPPPPPPAPPPPPPPPPA